MIYTQTIEPVLRYYPQHTATSLERKPKLDSRVS
jgi:hypothetical protein